MVAGPPTKEIEIVEEILWDEATGLVDFILIDHPSHTGHLTNKVEVRTNEEGQEEVWVTFRMEWIFKGEGEDPLGADMIKGGVVKTVAYIE